MSYVVCHATHCARSSCMDGQSEVRNEEQGGEYGPVVRKQAMVSGTGCHSAAKRLGTRREAGLAMSGWAWMAYT